MLSFCDVVIQGNSVVLKISLRLNCKELKKLKSVELELKFEGSSSKPNKVQEDLSNQFISSL